MNRQPKQGARPKSDKTIAKEAEITTQAEKDRTAAASSLSKYMIYLYESLPKREGYVPLIQRINAETGEIEVTYYPKD